MPSEPRFFAPAEEPSTGPAPRVSVVIPAWNRRDTLRTSVESVLRQTFTDFELIVVDDGSTDGTIEVIADIADPRIGRLAYRINQGMSAARNTDIRAARGEWVAFQDSDDEWLPGKLEKQMARLEGTEPKPLACNPSRCRSGCANCESSGRYCGNVCGLMMQIGPGTGARCLSKPAGGKP